MSKAKGKKGQNPISALQTQPQKQQDQAVSLTPEGYILIRVHAKPGAKQSLITDVGAEEVGVALAAPPREGQANEELLRTMMEFLGLRKNEISFEKGAKSRSKMIVITSKTRTVDEIRQKLEESCKST